MNRKCALAHPKESHTAVVNTWTYGVPGGYPPMCPGSRTEGRRLERKEIRNAVGCIEMRLGRCPENPGKKAGDIAPGQRAGMTELLGQVGSVPGPCGETGAFQTRKEGEEVQVKG